MDSNLVSPQPTSKRVARATVSLVGAAVLILAGLLAHRHYWSWGYADEPTMITVLPFGVTELFQGTTYLPTGLRLDTAFPRFAVLGGPERVVVVSDSRGEVCRLGGLVSVQMSPGTISSPNEARHWRHDISEEIRSRFRPPTRSR